MIVTGLFTAVKKQFVKSVLNGLLVFLKVHSLILWYTFLIGSFFCKVILANSSSLWNIFCLIIKVY